MVLKTNTLFRVTKPVHKFQEKITLADGRQTTVYFVRYDRDKIKASVVSFNRLTRLLPWCHANGVDEAIDGGFFLNDQNLPMGELWVQGQRQDSYAFPAPWHQTRGCVLIENDALNIAPRNLITDRPTGSLLQAGPTLVRKGISTYLAGDDPDGFTQTAYLHDEPLNAKRHPRAAIGGDSRYIWTVSCDGRRPGEAGLYLDELAEIFVRLGARDALNLDGGRRTTHISEGRLLNKPGTGYSTSIKGFGVFDAIIFEKR